jgi:peptide deformylase
MKVLQFGDPILRKQCRTLPVEDIQKKEVKACAANLITIMQGLKNISPSNGNGLSAPQIGSSIRLIVIFHESSFHQMYNPEIITKSNETFDAQEGCLSCFYLRAPVRRHKEISIVYLDEHAAKQKTTFTDSLAALVQHEIDHLDGILFIDRVTDTTQISSIDYLLRENQERLKQIKNMIDYVLDDPVAN